MNILIAGCGRVGAGLANALYKEGHDVSVVDRDPESFVLLEDAFTGFRLAGEPIDSAVLRRAGIEECHLVAAVTGDDNTNLMVAQIAREIFRVPKVLTRLYDPARQDIYEQEGLHTVCPTNLTVDLIQQIISQADQDNTRVVFGGACQPPGQDPGPGGPKRRRKHCGRPAEGRRHPLSRSGGELSSEKRRPGAVRPAGLEGRARHEGNRCGGGQGGVLPG